MGGHALRQLMGLVLALVQVAQVGQRGVAAGREPYVVGQLLLSGLAPLRLPRRGPLRATCDRDGLARLAPHLLAPASQGLVVELLGRLPVGTVGERCEDLEHLGTLLLAASPQRGGTLVDPPLDPREPLRGEELLEQVARCSEVACRKEAKPPCGSSTTCMNCSELIASSGPSSWPTSCARLETSVSVPSGSISVSRAPAGSRVVPVPRFLGRSHPGQRSTRSRRPPRVSSRCTRVGVCGSAADERRLRTSRCPGTTPYNAKQTASRTLVLPAPVGPVSRKTPASLSWSKSTSWRSA